jgi:osmotically-inducible protein OsmY
MDVSQQPPQIAEELANLRGADAADRNVCEARMRLARTSPGGFRHVLCEGHSGRLVLSGRVTSFGLKQLAQEIVRRVDGVQAIVNRLEVD